MSKQILEVCVLLGVIVMAFGQQTFRKKGEHYLAKVAIHREKPYPLRDGGQALPNTHNYYQHQPWRQGDRITKDEVVQNLARELLSRKRPSNEIQEERQKENQEKLHQYTLYQVKLAREASERPFRRAPYRPNNQPAGNNHAYPQRFYNNNRVHR